MCKWIALLILSFLPACLTGESVDRLGTNGRVIENRVKIGMRGEITYYHDTEAGMCWFRHGEGILHDEGCKHFLKAAESKKRSRVK